MAKFEIDKSGYNISQVDEYIDSLTLKYEKRLSEQKDKLFALKNEYNMLETNLSESKLKEEEVSKALLFAVEKSEQIEKSSKKIYDLEVRRMRLMYAKWKDMLAQFDKNTLYSMQNGKVWVALQDFGNDLDMIVKQNEEFDNNRPEDKSVKDSLKENSSNYIKNLLNRMEYLIETEPSKEEVEKSKAKKLPKQTKASTDLSETTKKENARLLSISRKLNSISQKLSLKSGPDILDDDLSNDNAYFRNLTRNINEEDESFDLDAILNPKEDLAEIMKAFDEI